MEKIGISISELKHDYHPGRGHEIHAFISTPVNCAEFVMKGNWFQPIVGSSKEGHCSIGYEPWIQFAPESWQNMIEKIFKEMVEAWNEKYKGRASEQHTTNGLAVTQSSDCSTQMPNSQIDK